MSDISYIYTRFKLTCLFMYSAKSFIDQAIAQGGRVLVHCNGTPIVTFHLPRHPNRISDVTGGISLSPAFVVMFVMQHYNLSWEDALHMVQNRRYCISPNGGFLTQIKVAHVILYYISPLNHDSALQEYESIYKATRAVAAYPMAQRQISRRKREDDDEEDEQR